LRSRVERRCKQDENCCRLHIMRTAILWRGIQDVASRSWFGAWFLCREPAPPLLRVLGEMEDCIHDTAVLVRLKLEKNGEGESTNK
jgi:hypothetical protein